MLTVDASEPIGWLDHRDVLAACAATRDARDEDREAPAPDIASALVTP